MSVIYKCLYCGKEIESDCIFEGKAIDFLKFVEDKTKELSEQCECRDKNYFKEILNKYGRNR